MALPRTMPVFLANEPSQIFRKHRGVYRYTRVAFRKPRKGEFYVSGAIPGMYEAPNDLPHEFLVVKPDLDTDASLCPSCHRRL